MFPTRAVGAVKCYARLDRGEPFSFEPGPSPARGTRLRYGRTLLFLKVDGVEPGGEIEVKGRGQLEVQAMAESVIPWARSRLFTMGVSLHRAQTRCVRMSRSKAQAG